MRMALVPLALIFLAPPALAQISASCVEIVGPALEMPCDGTIVDVLFSPEADLDSDLPPSEEFTYADPRTQRAVDLYADGRVLETLQLGEEIAATSTTAEAKYEGYFAAGRAMTYIALANRDALQADRAISLLESAGSTGWLGSQKAQSYLLSAKSHAQLAAGKAREDMFHFSEAERIAREALRLDPSNLEAHFFLAVSLTMQGFMTGRKGGFQEGISLLRLSRTAAEEQGDTGLALAVDNFLRSICAQRTC
jgi:tetratricopeptide (TPR) repeat protein